MAHEAVNLSDVDSRISTHAADANAHHKKTEPMCKVTLSTDQSVDPSTLTVIAFDSEIWDPGGNFDTGTHKFTAPVAGYYLVVLAVQLYSASADAYIDLYVSTNGTALITTRLHTSTTGYASGILAGVLHLTSGQQIYGEVVHSFSAAANLLHGESLTHLDIHLLNPD